MAGLVQPNASFGKAASWSPFFNPENLEWIPMHTSSNPSQFPRSQTVEKALQAFAEQMERTTTLSDGVLTARVIGEFSAGKTRLLRELLGELIPTALFPVSSLERQTRLQLEITHGEVPALTLIAREQDHCTTAVTLKTLTKFPERDALTDYNPLLHRLRLALPEPRLILPTGDGFSEDASPKRLFLIDTPGWNSGDDELAESDATQIMAGYHNLALVYVTDVIRLDGAENAERLLEFLDALAQAEFLETTPTLLFIVTHCPTEEANHQKNRARKLVLAQWEKLGRAADELNLNLFCVDFGTMKVQALQSFRDDFWQALLLPLGHKDKVADPWLSALRQWPKEWNVGPPVANTQAMLAQARQLLERARKGDEFVGGMNIHRLRGLDTKGMVQKVRDTWLHQLGCSATDLASFMSKPPQDLPAEHPLSAWWKHYWLANCRQALEPVKAFFKQAEQAIGELTPKTEDIPAHFDAKLAPAYQQALATVDNSFTALVETAQQVINEPLAEKVIATLMTLSLLQARYADDYAIHSAATSER
jgi:hypothetical protein